MNTAKRKEVSKVRMLPNQHVFNTQIHRLANKTKNHTNTNRLLIYGLIISQLALAAWNVYTINSINEAKLNQQIINQESIPVHLEQITM